MPAGGETLREGAQVCVHRSPRLPVRERGSLHTSDLDGTEFLHTAPVAAGHVGIRDAEGFFVSS